MITTKNLKKVAADANIALILSGLDNGVLSVNDYRVGDAVQVYNPNWLGLRSSEIWQVCCLTRDGGVYLNKGKKVRELR